MASLDKRRAKRLVQDIAKEHVHLSEEFLQGLGRDQRREIEEALLKKDLAIGSTVINLAKNLRSSKAHFVLELLKNADNNKFTRAVASGHVPFVSFLVYPRRIVVECNEDGFTPEDVKAICCVGQSSKTGTQGYVGKKGIGFKSVFMAARKVHIQSGPFSFSFRHNTGDSGMGMISPVWEDTDEDTDEDIDEETDEDTDESSDDDTDEDTDEEAEESTDEETDEEASSPLTRITLHLRGTGKPQALAKTAEAIQAQFKELQDTILLFLKNIQEVEVKFYDDGEKKTSHTRYRLDHIGENSVVLRRTKDTNRPGKRFARRFHVTRHVATRLASSEDRTYSQTGEAAEASSQSEVVLAFPLSNMSTAIIKPQNVFAFLPVRRVGFNFLVHADFVTDAKRQDIVEDSPRNAFLREAVVDAFVKAVTQFWDYGILRYHWTRFLPDRQSAHWDAFWAPAVEGIARKLTDTPILQDEDFLSPPRFIRDLCILTRECLDSDGEPLFDDGHPRQTVSRCYYKQALEVLKKYGLRNVDFSDIIRWLEMDLQCNETSRMKSPTAPEDWHGRVASLLTNPFTEKSTTDMEKLREMDLLPLDDGSWASASSGPIYFPQTAGLDVPVGIGLRVLAKTSMSRKRKVLFKELGVKTAPTDLVCRSIVSYYNSQPEKFGLETSNIHLRFLYMTAHLLEEPLRFDKILIVDRTGKSWTPHQKTMYMANDDPYGAWEVFRKTDRGPSPGDNAPGFQAAYVNDQYFVDEPAARKKQHLSWRDWFHEVLHVKRHIVLGFAEKYSATEYIRRCRPDKFLGCLFQWYDPATPPSAELISHLRESFVLCRGGKTFPLSDTYFPEKKLQERVTRFVGKNDWFHWPWLDTEEVYGDIPPKWNTFLSAFGCPTSDLSFALEMLRRSTLDRWSNLTDLGRERLFALYRHIQTQYQESENLVKAAEEIRETFRKDLCIYVPLGADKCAWAAPKNCVWSAPQRMQTKFALELLYRPWLQLDGADGSYYASFFRNTLNIGNCTWEIFVGELRELKASKCEDIGRLSTIYRALNALREEPLAIWVNDVKTAFESEALIFLPMDDGTSWHKVSQCFWSSATRLEGNVSLNDEYENLKGFFVDFLGVKPMDLSMAIDELKDAATRQTATASEVKESIWTINSLLQMSPAMLLSSSRKILESPIFPVKHPDGRVTLEPATVEFCIIDRASLSSSFASKVKFLDFTLGQVVQLRLFIEWTKLGSRYLSRCVKEITSFQGVATPASNPRRQIRNRAHALLRIAAHFDSPRAQNRQEMESFYDILRSAEICETNGVWSDISVVQDGISHIVEDKKKIMHINETDSGLKIYMPRDGNNQEYMFISILPRKLFEWMMEHSTTCTSQEITSAGVDATKNILLAPVAMLQRALEDTGIATIDVANVDEAATSGENPPPQTMEDERGYDNTTMDDQSDSSSEGSKILLTPSTGPSVNQDDADGDEVGQLWAGQEHHDFLGVSNFPSPRSAALPFRT